MFLMVISTHGIQPIASSVYKRERDDVPMSLRNVELPRFPLRSTSMCIPVRDDEYEEETYQIGCLYSFSHQLRRHWAFHLQVETYQIGCLDLHRENQSASHMPSCRKKLEEIGGQVPKNEHLLMFGPLGQFDNPDCVNCPPARKNKRHFHRGSNASDNKLHNTISGRVGGWKKKIEKIVSNIPIMNPNAKVVQQWNQFFVISCLISIFIDPLFFLLSSVEQMLGKAGSGTDGLG